MTTADKLDKLSKIVGGFEKSNWLEQAKQRQANSDEIFARQKIALLILRTLRQTQTSQKQLAKMLDVSPQQVNKWVKGSENFSIATIIKIQQALNIVLIEIAEPKQYLRTSEFFNNTGVYTQIKTALGLYYTAPLKQEKVGRSDRYNQTQTLACA